MSGRLKFYLIVLLSFFYVSGICQDSLTDIEQMMLQLGSNKNVVKSSLDIKGYEYTLKDNDIWVKYKNNVALILKFNNEALLISCTFSVLGGNVSDIVHDILLLFDISQYEYIKGFFEDSYFHNVYFYKKSHIEDLYYILYFIVPTEYSKKKMGTVSISLMKLDELKPPC